MTTDVFKTARAKIKDNRFILAALIFGVILMLMPRAKTEKAADPPQQEPAFSIEVQEKKLEALLEEIDGAGKVQVMLSLKSGTEQILAKDEDLRDGVAERETVIVSSGSGKQSAVTVKYVYPVYMGAAVVAEGADKATVRLAIVETVSAVTGLDAGQISVIKMKNH